MAFEDALSSTNIRVPRCLGGTAAHGGGGEQHRQRLFDAHATGRTVPSPGRGVLHCLRRPCRLFLGGQPARPGAADRLAGVRVDGIIEDQSELARVYNPGHPDADASGFVLYPNVQIPIEMVNLITANRAYEANLKVLQAFRQQAEQALLLARA